MLYRISQLIALFIALFPAVFSNAWGQSSSEAEIWRLWQQPGVHAIMRHATAPGFGDPENFVLGNCKTQRNLSNDGRKEAQALGQVIQSKGVELTAIFSSQWCRCLHTAQEMKLGDVQELPALNSFFQDRGTSAAQTAALKEHLASLKPSDKVLYVTHQVNTTALTGVYPNSGEIILFKIAQDESIQVIGRIKANP